MLNAANNQQLVSAPPAGALPPVRSRGPDPTDRAARARRVLSRVAWWANVVAVAIILLAILGWIGDYPALRTLGADFPSLPFVTALLLLLAAGALAAARRETPAAERAARIGATLVVIGAAGALVLHSAGIETGAELGLSVLTGRGAELPARISSAVAITLLLVAAGIALTPLRTPLAEITHRVVALAVVGIAFLAIVGLSFRLLLVYGVAPLLGMSLPDAITFLLIGVNLLAGRPDAWLVDLLAASGRAR